MARIYIGVGRHAGVRAGDLVGAIAGEYGFPESHAASFALLVYVSAWLKHHYPAAFTCALLNSQPMGFYGPAQLVRDAKAHNVDVLPIDVNHSRWECTLEADDKSAQPDLRLGLRQVMGLAQQAVEPLAETVGVHGPFTSIESLWHTAGISIGLLRRLAEADAYQSMHLDRQHALWQIMKLRDTPAPLFEQATYSAKPSSGRSKGPDHPDALPPLHPLKQMTLDYAPTGLSLKQHPLTAWTPPPDPAGPCASATGSARPGPPKTRHARGISPRTRGRSAPRFSISRVVDVADARESTAVSPMALPGPPQATP